MSWLYALLELAVGAVIFSVSAYIIWQPYKRKYDEAMRKFEEEFEDDEDDS